MRTRMSRVSGEIAAEGSFGKVRGSAATNRSCAAAVRSMYPRGGDGRLCRKQECLGFDFHENAAKRSDAAVKCRRLGTLEVEEKACDPRLKMCLEDVAIGSGGSSDPAAGKAGHDFEK